MLPKVSIIIPVYNVEPYIAECVQSVMRQTYRGMMECILVDDCGTDKTIEVVEQLIKEYSGPVEFRILHHEHNRGVSAARNTGIGAACGEYLYFIDSDDWISEDCIEKLVQPLAYEPYDFVMGRYFREGRGTCVSCPEGAYYRNRLKMMDQKSGIPVAVWNRLYRKQFLTDNQLRFEVGRIFEDSIFSFDLSCVERKYYVVDATTYYYRWREGSISLPQNRSVKLKDYVALLRSLKDRVSQDNYRKLDRIYDYYLHWVKTVFRWISTVEMDESMLAYVQKETQGFLDVIPSIRYLSNKHDRVLYFFCRKDQTYLHFQKVKKQYTEKYANRLSGKILRNLLNLIPSPHVDV